MRRFVLTNRDGDILANLVTSGSFIAVESDDDELLDHVDQLNLMKSDSQAWSSSPAEDWLNYYMNGMGNMSNPILVGRVSNNG